MGAVFIATGIDPAAGSIWKASIKTQSLGVGKPFIPGKLGETKENKSEQYWRVTIENYLNTNNYRSVRRLQESEGLALVICAFIQIMLGTYWHRNSNVGNPGDQVFSCAQ